VNAAEPQSARGHEGARNPFDRAPGADRVDHRPSGYAARKPAAPAGKGGFKPQRPRSGGYTR
jgi:hypothetical protein